MVLMKRLLPECRGLLGEMGFIPTRPGFQPGTWFRRPDGFLCTQRGNVVRRNTIHGTFNGIGPCGSSAPPDGIANETDVYDNILYQHTDGYTASTLKINSGYQTPIGPLYLYHNTFLTYVPDTDAITRV